MKVLVTGISGFLGSALAHRLLKDGHEVAGYLRQTNRLNDVSVQNLMGKAQMYYGSVTDYAAVKRMLYDFQPEGIVHLGAVSPVAYSFEHPHEVFETNAVGTINMAEAALKECRSLQKAILASSMETYGMNPKRTPYVETDEQMPAAPYAVAKVAAERYWRYMHYAYGMPTVALRQTNCYGRIHNDYFVVERIVVQMLKGKVCNLGDNRPIRNFLFVDDLIDLYCELLKSGEVTNGQVYNTGPANGLTIGELALKIKDKLKWEGQINWHTRPVRPGEIFHLDSSNEKITEAIGWSPKVSLDEGLDRTIEIWKKNLGV